MLQTAGYQAILHGHAGGYRSHVLAGGRWTVWHSTARQRAFPPLPHVDWQQGPTQAYYMSAVCMFSPADAHIVVCDPERLPGPEAVIRVADCTRMIIKALREGEHHALLLQVRLKDNARAARPGVWPAAAHPADLELQLAVPTAV